MRGELRSEAGQHRVLDAEEPPRQARAIIHVEYELHGARNYTRPATNDNPAAGGTAGQLVRNRDFEIRV